MLGGVGLRVGRRKEGNSKFETNSKFESGNVLKRRMASNLAAADGRAKMKQGKEDGGKEDGSQVARSQTEFICLVIFFSTIFFSQPCLESPILRWLRTKAAPRLINDELER